MPRRVCLSIAVSHVTPPAGGQSRFAYLDGAPLAAEAIGEWARRVGFGDDNVRVVTDQPQGDGKANPVTEARVQAAVDALFPNNGKDTDHLILSFCGHGLTAADVGSAFWLFSDALEQRYRINVDAFVSEFRGYGVKRISLISDACRDAPKDLDLMRLESRRGITGRGQRNGSPRFDRMAACQDGQKAYMVVVPGGADRGKCILSGVVLDVLWGNEPGAFRNDVIDTHTFSLVTRDRAEERARDYRLDLKPQASVDPEAVILVDGAARPTPVPQLQPWPAAAHVISMGAIMDKTATVERGAELSFERLHSDQVFRESVLGRDFGTSHPDLDVSIQFPGLPNDARNLLDELFALRRLKHDDDSWIGAQISSTLSALEGKSAAYARAAAADALHTRFEKLALTRYADQFHLLVTGGHVRNVWSDHPIRNESTQGDLSHFRVEQWLNDSGTQVVIEFDNGEFVPVYLYRSLFAVVIRNSNGTAAIAYGGGSPEVLWTSAEAVTQLTRGTFSSANIEQLAARIRSGKHANPVLGAIAAYLYRQISDFDNICRMAYYYVDHDHPVPFDIALLGQLEVYLDGDKYFVKVPAVTARQQELDRRTPLPPYVTANTPAVTGQLGGRCPWLTIGWDYPRAELFGDKIYDHNRDLAQLFRPSSFTCLARKLGEHLVDLWNLKPYR